MGTRFAARPSTIAGSRVGNVNRSFAANNTNIMRGNQFGNRTIVNNTAATWNRGNWNGHWGGWGGNWGGFGGRGFGWGGFGRRGFGWGGFGWPGFGWGGFWPGFGLGLGLGFWPGYGLGLGYGGYGGFGGYGYPGYGYGGYGGYGYPGYGYDGLGYGSGMLGWGLPSWGLGTWPYTSGYAVYDNPYAAVGQAAVANPALNYSQPIGVDSTPPAEPAINTGSGHFDAARGAFKAGDYTNALNAVDQALVSLPNDLDLHQFRGLTLFALGRYDQAAAALHAVVSAGPGWNWATLVGLYPNVETFTTQLRALEAFCAEHPGSAPPRFVLAYLYLTMGETTAAASELRQVVQLQPDDRLSAQLLSEITKTAANPAAPSPTNPPAGGQPAAPPPADLVGTWKATGADSSTVELKLSPDGHFTWTHTSQQTPQSFEGQYTAGNGLLTLVRSNGQAIVGRLTGAGENRFNFKLLGGGPGDPGLTFAR
jgi:hypothetical protein